MRIEQDHPASDERADAGNLLSHHGAIIRDLLSGLLLIHRQEAETWKSALRASITSAAAILVLCVAFGPKTGSLALFGSMLALWESDRGLLARLKAGVLVGLTITGSMAIGVLVAPQRELAIATMTLIIVGTSLAYYSFVLTRGPGPLHLFYGAAIGSYFGLFGDVGWSIVCVTGLSCLTTAIFTLAFLIPDQYHPEKRAIIEAQRAVDAYRDAAGKAVQIDAQLRILRARAYDAVNRAWLLLQDNAFRTRAIATRPGYTSRIHAFNRELASVAAKLHFSDAGIMETTPDTPPLLGHPGFLYLLRHGFRRHSIAWFTAWRLGVAGALSGSISQLLGLGHPYWAVLTSTIVLHLWIGRIATTQRAIHRAVGTAVGLTIVGFVAWIAPPAWGLVALIIVCLAGMNFTLNVNYAIAIVFVTPMSLLAIETATGGPTDQLIHDRLVETLIGVGVSVLVTWASGLREPRRIVRDQNRRTLAAIRRVLVFIEQGQVLTVDGRKARVELLFELQMNNIALSRAASDDTTLHAWRELETAVCDLGYLTLAACWIADAGEPASLEAALVNLDALLKELAIRHHDRDYPSRIITALMLIEKLVLSWPQTAGSLHARACEA